MESSLNLLDLKQSARMNNVESFFLNIFSEVPRGSAVKPLHVRPPSFY